MLRRRSYGLRNYLVHVGWQEGRIWEDTDGKEEGEEERGEEDLEGGQDPMSLPQQEVLPHEQDEFVPQASLPLAGFCKKGRFVGKELF